MYVIIVFKVVSVEAMEECKLVIVVPSTSFKYFDSQHRQFRYTDNSDTKRAYDN